MFLLGVCCVGPPVNTGPFYQSYVRVLWRSLGERATTLDSLGASELPLQELRGWGGPGGHRDGTSLPWQVNKGGGVRVNGWAYGQLKVHLDQEDGHGESSGHMYSFHGAI